MSGIGAMIAYPRDSTAGKEPRMGDRDRELDELLRKRQTDADDRDAAQEERARALGEQLRQVDAYMQDVGDEVVVQLGRELRRRGISVNSRGPGLARDKHGVTAGVSLSRPGMRNLELTLRVVPTETGIRVSLAESDRKTTISIEPGFDDAGRAALHDAMLGIYVESLRGE
jgi:hypothetical protein